MATINGKIVYEQLNKKQPPTPQTNPKFIVNSQTINSVHFCWINRATAIIKKGREKP